MKRHISLYIDSKLADLTDDGLVLWNFTQEELDNPTAVKNSWTNSVTLPLTPANNNIFDDAFRVDRRNATGRFNPRIRTPFAIYDSAGLRLQSGYVKLNRIDDAGYNVTLYGGLGSMLYALTYDANGDALTLADLDYLQTGTPATELNFTLSRSNLLSAWQDLETPGQATVFAVINFAPCYNGIPDKFGADKCLFDLDAYEYNAAGQAIAKLSRKYTEREMSDFRTYLQRPVISVQATLQAIVRFAATLGYTLDISNWDYQGNSFCEDVWMTLPMLKEKRSGDTVTKADLLGGTCSPAAFLLGVVRTFGLKLISNGANVTIFERHDFFQQTTKDLTPRVDLTKAPTVVPIAMDATWYEFASEDNGEFAKKYLETTGRHYGAKRLGTGYEFAASVKQVVTGLPFKGCVQSQEMSTAFRTVSNRVEQSGSFPYYKNIPAPFLDGGTYALPDGHGGQEGKILISGIFVSTWWNSTYNGYDDADMPQLHEADNKAMDGSGVLLFYTGSQNIAGGVVSDDVADMGEEPCWNCSSVGTTTISILPHFSRFLLDQGGDIEKSLDWGAAGELNLPGLQYANNFVGVYDAFWADYMADRYDEDTKIVTLRLLLSGLQVGAGLLRTFWWWRGSLWVINKITNYSITTNDPTECELVQVRDITNYAY
ncbi:MAG: hypothetical protein K6A62_04685 [Bacteroidales bacterium]|nr:hypothetical protein [Bacteroidales bacterium]